MSSKAQQALEEFKIVAQATLNTIDKINKELEKEVGEVWLSTPALKDIIETNGKGEFRLVKEGRTLKYLHSSAYGRACTYTYPLPGAYKTRGGWYSESITISLQKFVATIYHPNLNNAIATRVKDGNPKNLHKDNVEWISQRRIY